MPIYFGWAIIAMTMIANMLVMGATIHSFGLYVIPVSEEMGLSRATMNTAFVLINIGNASLAPFVGRMVDKYSIRMIMRVCAMLLGAGFVIISLSHSLLLSAFVLAVLIPLGVDGGVLITLVVLEARWFKVFRTRAMALSAIGLSLGGAVVAPLTAVLIDHFGWRASLSISGTVIAAVLILFSLIIREHPGPRDVETGIEKKVRTAGYYQPKSTGRTMAVLEVLRLREFWLIGMGMSLAFATFNTLSISLVPFAVDQGLTNLKATSLVSTAAVAGIVAKLVLGVLGDRANRIGLLIMMIVAAIFLNSALLVVSGYWSLFSCAILLGIVLGTSIPVFQAFVADTFGAMSFGTVRGLMVPITAVCNAIAMRFAGEVYDLTSSYQGVFVAFIGTLLLSATMMLVIYIGVARTAGQTHAGQNSPTN